MLNYYKLFIPLLILHSSFLAQVNLVVNPSFETYTTCPSAPGDILKANPWQSLCATPDYYNTCASSGPGSMDVPVNWAGYQQPASGNAYAGFATYSNAGTNLREFVAGSLISPLAIGVKYYISFKISLSLGFVADANCATDKIGATFSTGSFSCGSLIKNNAAAYTSSIIGDSSNWTRITGSFVSDSAYNYILIGNFFDDANTTIQQFYSTFSNLAYYFLDDVCLSTDSLYAYTYDFTGLDDLNDNKLISVFPNPVDDYLVIRNPSGTPLDISINNAFGTELVSVKGNSEEFYRIDLRGFNSGLFMVSLRRGHYVTKYKILKQ